MQTKVIEYSRNVAFVQGTTATDHKRLSAARVKAILG